jgi:hypothetical protein
VLITDPPVQSKAHSVNIALLANYMATSFVDVGGGLRTLLGAATLGHDNQHPTITFPHG